MPGDQFEDFRETYKRLVAAQEHHMSLMRRAFAGKPYDADELMKSATEVQRRTAEFMKAGEPFIHWKK